MLIIAYLYTDPLLDTPVDPQIWGWEIDRVYQDIGQRQQLIILLKEAATAPPDYLLIRKIEELGDTVETVYQNLSQIEALGTKIITTEAENRTDFLKLLHEIQSYHQSRRIRQGHARNRLAAKPPPGKAPYGYKRGSHNYILDRRTAPVVKEFFDQFLLFGSLRGAVRYLEKKYGKKISATTGQRWLINPVYRGDRVFKTGQILTDTHEAILSREEAAQIDRLLKRNRRLPPRSASAPRSLAGLVICGECQSSMTITRVTQHRQDQEYLYLRPLHCPHRPKCKALAYDQVLSQTIATICRDLKAAITSQPVFSVQPNPGLTPQSIQEAIAQKQMILAQLPQLIATEILDSETAQLREYKLRTEIAQLQNRFAQLPPVNLRSIADAISLPQFWLDLSEAERRFYFREFIRQIQILRLPSQPWELRLIFPF